MVCPFNCVRCSRNRNLAKAPPSQFRTIDAANADCTARVDTPGLKNDFKRPTYYLAPESPEMWPVEPKSVAQVSNPLPLLAWGRLARSCAAEDAKRGEEAPAKLQRCFGAMNAPDVIALHRRSCENYPDRASAACTRGPPRLGRLQPLHAGSAFRQGRVRSIVVAGHERHRRNCDAHSAGCLAAKRTAGQGVKDFRFREEVSVQLLHPGPGSVILLASPPERS